MFDFLDFILDHLAVAGLIMRTTSFAAIAFGLTSGIPEAIKYWKQKKLIPLTFYVLIALYIIRMFSGWVSYEMVY